MYLKKLNLSIIHWVCHLVKHSNKIRLNVLLKTRVISVMIVTTPFLIFTKGVMNLMNDMSLGSKYNIMKNFNLTY